MCCLFVCAVIGAAAAGLVQHAFFAKLYFAVNHDGLLVVKLHQFHCVYAEHLVNLFQFGNVQAAFAALYFGVAVGGHAELGCHFFLRQLVDFAEAADFFVDFHRFVLLVSLGAAGRHPNILGGRQGQSVGGGAVAAALTFRAPFLEILT